MCYVCVYAYTNTSVCILAYAYLHMHTCIHMYVYMYTNAYILIHIYTSTHMHVHTYAQDYMAHYHLIDIPIHFMAGLNDNLIPAKDCFKAKSLKSLIFTDLVWHIHQGTDFAEFWSSTTRACTGFHLTWRLASPSRAGVYIYIYIYMFVGFVRHEQNLGFFVFMIKYKRV